MRETIYRIGTPLRMAVVADLHEHSPSAVLEILRRERPDVICVPGDTLERHDVLERLDAGDPDPLSRALCDGIDLVKGATYHLRERHDGACSANAYRLLRQAGRIAPVLLSVGNHELYFTAMDRRVMAECGTVLLDNRMQRVRGVLFGGLTSAQRDGEPDEAFLERFAAQPGYKVLLCHHPEYFDSLRLGERGIDLVISGHCHGGQIRIGGRGLFSPGQGFWPKYHHGVYPGRDGKLVVSAGCSNTTVIPRIGNPCEVVLIR